MGWYDRIGRRIKMICKVGDTISRFFIATIRTKDPRDNHKLMYAYIDKINQVQLVARNKSNKDDGTFDDNMIKCTNQGSRTTIDRIGSNYYVPVQIEEVDLDHIMKMCSDICDVKYSTRMSEDKQLRF